MMTIQDNRQSIPTDLEPHKRDPEGRKRAIVQAAAELIVEQGPVPFTHRAVAARSGVSLGSTTMYFDSIDALRAAALQMLADEIDDELSRIEREVDSVEDLPRVGSRIIHEFLLDRRQVRASLALAAAGMSEPNLRELTEHWNIRLTEILTRYIDYEHAIAIQIFIDGAVIHAAFHDEPISRTTIEQTLRAILSIPTIGEEDRSCLL